MTRKMRLAELLPDVAAVPADLEIGGLVMDSREVSPGDAFVAIAGFGAHGLNFVAQARAARVMVGLAGALRLVHAHALAELAPDFAGFRSAVCAGERSGALDPARVRELAAAMRLAQLALARVSPSSSPRMRASSAR